MGLWAPLRWVEQGRPGFGPSKLAIIYAVESRKRSRAFTLVEILTTLAIIMVLAGILLGVLNSGRARARVTSCASNLSQIGAALLLYVGDHDEQLPPFLSGFDQKGMLATPSEFSPWKMALKPYGAASELFYCPSDMFARRSVGDPFASRADHFQTSYATPRYFGQFAKGGFFDASMSDFPKPSETLYIFDDGIRVEERRDEESVLLTPHGLGANGVYLDGHTKFSRRIDDEKLPGAPEPGRR